MMKKVLEQVVEMKRLDSSLLRKVLLRQLKERLEVLGQTAPSESACRAFFDDKILPMLYGTSHPMESMNLFEEQLQESGAIYEVRKDATLVPGVSYLHSAAWTYRDWIEDIIGEDIRVTASDCTFKTVDSGHKLWLLLNITPDRAVHPMCLGLFTYEDNDTFNWAFGFALSHFPHLNSPRSVHFMDEDQAALGSFEAICSRATVLICSFHKLSHFHDKAKNAASKSSRVNQSSVTRPAPTSSTTTTTTNPTPSSSPESTRAREGDANDDVEDMQAAARLRLRWSEFDNVVPVPLPDNLVSLKTDVSRKQLFKFIRGAVSKPDAMGRLKTTGERWPALEPYILNNLVRRLDHMCMYGRVFLQTWGLDTTALCEGTIGRLKSKLGVGVPVHAFPALSKDFFKDLVVNVEDSREHSVGKDIKAMLRDYAGVASVGSLLRVLQSALTTVGQFCVLSALQLSDRMEMVISFDDDAIGSISETAEKAAHAACCAAYTAKTGHACTKYFVQPKQLYAQSSSSAVGGASVVALFTNGAWICSCRQSHTLGCVCAHFMLLWTKGHIAFNPMAHMDSPYMSAIIRLAVEKAYEEFSVGIESTGAACLVQVEIIKPTSGVRFGDVADSSRLVLHVSEGSVGLVVSSKSSSCDNSGGSEREALEEEMKKLWNQTWAHVRAEQGNDKLVRMLNLHKDLQREWAIQSMRSTGLKVQEAQARKKKRVPKDVPAAAAAASAPPQAEMRLLAPPQLTNQRRKKRVKSLGVDYA
jgi:hypothetical protein